MTSQEVTSYNQRRLSRGEPSLPRAEQLLLERAVDDSLFGLGRLQPLIDLEGLENLLIAGYDNARLEFGDGRIERGAKVAESNAELDRLLKHVAETMSGGTKTFSSSNCVLNMALPDDARLAAAIRISDVPRISIRKHNHTDVDLAQLSRETQVLDRGMLQLLTASTRAGLNIVYSGLPGAGKTTIARSTLHMLPPEVHIGTIETKYELFLHRNRERHHFVTNFQELLSTGESAEEATYDVSRLLEMILQHSPERVVIGELLGPEILTLFKVLQSTKGSVSTLHSDTADDAIERLATLLLEAGPQFNTQFAYRQIAQNIDLIVHVDSIDQRSLPGGRRHRFISEIRAPELAIDGASRGISAEQIYKPGPDGRGIPTGIRPSWINRLRNWGFDPNTWLVEGREAWERPLNVLPVPGARPVSINIVLATLLAIAAVALAAAAIRLLQPPTPRDASRPAGALQSASLDGLLRRFGKRRVLTVLGALALGLLLALLGGWLIAPVLLPALAIVLPMVLTKPDRSAEEQLQALADWTRKVASLIASNKPLTEAIKESVRLHPARDPASGQAAGHPPQRSPAHRGRHLRLRQGTRPARGSGHRGARPRRWFRPSRADQHPDLHLRDVHQRGPPAAAHRPGTRRRPQHGPHRLHRQRRPRRCPSDLPVRRPVPHPARAADPARPDDVLCRHPLGAAPDGRHPPPSTHHHRAGGGAMTAITTGTAEGTVTGTVTLARAAHHAPSRPRSLR